MRSATAGLCSPATFCAMDRREPATACNRRSPTLLAGDEPRRASRRLRRALREARRARRASAPCFLSGYACPPRASARPTSGCSRRPRCSTPPRASLRRGRRLRCSSTSTRATAAPFNVERTVTELVRSAPPAASSRTRCGRSAAATWRASASCRSRSTCRSCAAARATAAAPASRHRAHRRARRRGPRRGHSRARARSPRHGADAVFVEAPRVGGRDGARAGGRPRARAAGREHGRAGEDAAPRPRPSWPRRAIASSLVPVAPLLASAHALRTLFATLRRDGGTRALATACSASAS